MPHACEGNWVLTGIEGVAVDGHQPWESRERFERWRLAGRTLVDFTWDHHPLPRFTMDFEGGWKLEAGADGDGLEDWSLAERQNRVVCNGAEITIFSQRADRGSSGAGPACPPQPDAEAHGTGALGPRGPRSPLPTIQKTATGVPIPALSYAELAQIELGLDLLHPRP
jgi:hypothetical protein